MAIGLTCALGLYLADLQLSGNFHTIVAGEAYRSAQPTSAEIDAYAKQYGIKTIINLRGASPNAPWYKAETAEAAKLGITHIDFNMSAGKQLSKARAEQIIAVLDKAEKPLLIHCKAGADRSGLVSALYLAAVRKTGEAAAERQISIRYGHFSLPFISTYAMNRTFESLEPSLGFSNS
ncbi:dual specificity protein phosphatase family protein [Phyllobacterium salinisoli]|nr:dual specificity protein phosphatase family protein [Phyllobacterium salinisoli]